jgi:hypothetical protein
MAQDVGGLRRNRGSSGRADKIASRLRNRRPLATFYHQGTAATRYWRITLPAKYLPGKVLAANDVLVRHNTKTQKLTFPQLHGDVAVEQFPGDNGSALFAMAMEAKGKRFFVEVDDNYIDYGDELWMKRASWGEKIRGDSQTSVQGHRWIVEHSYGVIVTTRALEAEYTKLNDNVHVCRNSIHPGDWPKPEPRDETFRIGWYASNSHDRDSVMVARALSWASRQPNVEIVNIGHDPGWSFTRRQVEWANDLFRPRRELCRLDVGVAPLVGAPLAKYRSDLKALEYAMGGAMPFLQRAEPYWEWEDKEFARMSTTPDDWMRQIKWAVANRDEVRARAQQARKYVLEHRTFRTEIERWRKAIAGGEA